MEIRLYKPLKQKIVCYQGTLIASSATERLIYTPWDHKTVDTGYVVFARDDHLYEYFYSDRWYTVFRLHGKSDKCLKGWYCNVARPAVFTESMIESEDLELDLFVSPDRQTILLLDEEEYGERGLANNDPVAHHAAQDAVVELRRLIAHGDAPFTDAVAGAPDHLAQM